MAETRAFGARGAHSNRFDEKRPFYSRAASCALPCPSDYTPELLHYADLLLRQVYRPGVQFLKAGIMLFELTPATRHRHDLLDERDHEKQAALMATVDALNQRFGRRTLQFGDLGNLTRRKPVWAARAEMLSPKYTTAWDQLATVR